jgi:antitoxin component of MazEF toxin-antitoxin module
MIKKLVQHGNSSALILDKTILQLLGADSESSFEIIIEGNSLIIRRAQQTHTKKTGVL